MKEKENKKKKICPICQTNRIKEEEKLCFVCKFREKRKEQNKVIVPL